MRIPNFEDMEITKFLVQWDLEIQRMREDNLSAVRGNRALLLYSPSKKVYEVTVSDTGVLSTTYVAG